MAKLDITRFNSLARTDISPDAISGLSIRQKQMLAINISKIKKQLDAIDKLIHKEVLESLNGLNVNLPNGTLTYRESGLRELVDTSCKEYDEFKADHHVTQEVPATYAATYREGWYE